MAVDLQTLEMEASADAKAEAEAPADTAAVVYKKGAWSTEEDEKLRRAVDKYGLRNWVAIEKYSGLGRPAKNCRLRWLNYLRPNLKKYPFTPEEEELIFQLHSKYGNSWSRIANKLPGRSDNEIKNFWHKRAKKRHKHHLPIYPSTTQNPNNIFSHHQQPDNPNNDDVSTSYHNNTLIHSPQLQPHTPNIINISSHANNDASIHSPQTVMSSHLQNPANHLTDPTTPTSQTQNLLISPHPRPQSSETAYLIPNASPRGQNGQSSNAFTMLMKPPPILSSPQGRFSRGTSKLSQNSVPNASSSILRQDSPMQMQFCSSAMESPRSPLKLNLSPRICSAQMNTQTTDSQVASFTQFHLQSPNMAPLSPLKLRLSIPIPSESCFQSNVSIQDSSVQLEPSSCGLDLPQTQPMAVDYDYNIPRDSSQAIKTETPSIQVESDSSFEIMQELREAQARVRFLKKKLKLKRTSNKTTDLMEDPADENSSESTSKECTLHTTSSGTKIFLNDISRVKGPPLQKNSRKKEISKKIPKKGEISESQIYTQGGTELEKATHDQNSETKTSLQRKSYSLNDIFNGEHSMTFDEQNHSIDFFNHHTQGGTELEKATHDENSETKTSLQRKSYSLNHIFKGEHSMAFDEQNHSIDFFNHHNIGNTANAPNSNSFDNKLCSFQDPAGNCSNERNTIDTLYDESSNHLQDSSLNGDLFGPVYSQSTTTTSQVKTGEHFGYSLGQHILDLETKFTENELLSESNLLQNQYLTTDPLDSSYLVSAPIMEQEYFRVEQFSFQSCQNSDENPKVCEAHVLLHQSPAANLIDNLIDDDSRYLVDFEEQGCGENYFAQEACREQGLMQCLLEDNNLWGDGQVVSQDQIFNWNDECGHTGDILKHEHDHMNTMSEELSSLLDFFPTTNQTLSWYNIGNGIHDTKASDEFNMGIDQQRHQHPNSCYSPRQTIFEVQP